MTPSTDDMYATMPGVLSPLVLVVDDNADCRTLIADLLREYGYRAEPLEDFDAILQRAASANPVLIVIDYLMPPRNGEDLVSRLRQNPATRHIPLGLMSSSRPRLPNLEGVPFLPKPFDLDDLLAFVKRLQHPHDEEK